MTPILSLPVLEPCGSAPPGACTGHLSPLGDDGDGQLTLLPPHSVSMVKLHPSQAGDSIWGLLGLEGLWSLLVGHSKLWNGQAVQAVAE